MKVVFVTIGFPRDATRPAGGLEAAVCGQATALVNHRANVELHVLSCPAERDEQLPPHPGRPFSVEYIRGSNPLFDLLPGSPASGRIRQRLIRLKPDIVHVQGGAQYVDGRRYRSVLTVHGLIERDTLYRHSKTGQIRSKINARFQGYHRGRFSHIIALTGYVRLALEGAYRGRFHFVPNPVEERFFELERRADEPVALFVAALFRLKNAHTLLRAIGRLKRAGVPGRLHLAGSVIDTGYERQLQTLIREENIGDRVKFLGPLDRGALWRELSSARCLVHPSFQENAPMSVAEAGAAGVPVVASATGGIPEMVAHQQTGFLIDPGSAASIADGLRPLLQDPHLADAFGQRARERAFVHHPKNVALQLGAIYEELLSEPLFGNTRSPRP